MVRLRGGGGECPALPDDVWLAVFSVCVDGMMRARRAASVSRMFAAIPRRMVRMTVTHARGEREPPPLPDDLWRMVFSVHCDGLLRARRAASVSRMIAEIARTHEDTVCGGEGGAVVVDREKWEEDDYICCECGTCVPAFAVLDEQLRDPWGNALRRTTVDHARTFIRMVLESGPGGWDWGWGVPVTIEMSQRYNAITHLWPGDVCSECWAEWGRDVDDYDAIGRYDGDTHCYQDSDDGSQPGGGSGSTDPGVDGA